MEQSEHTHDACVDGFKMEGVLLPENTTQGYRDAIRSEIAERHSIPKHYIKLIKRKRDRNV